MEDTQIIQLLFQRSERALGELEEKYGKRLRTLAFQLLGSSQDAEECVNDAYLGAWNAIPPAQPDCLLGYLCKIVRNLAIKRRNRNGAEKRNGGYQVALQELEECLPGPGGVEAEAEAGELADLLERFLDTLSRENRVIFLRRYGFCDSYAQIARKVGLSEKTVSVRLTRLRRQMREYLAERGRMI